MRSSGTHAIFELGVTDMKYKVILERSEEGVAASVPGLPGCWSQGESEAEALDNIRSAITEYLEVVNELT
jgi:predicted RNase H-like HicB family nuclease